MGKPARKKTKKATDRRKPAPAASKLSTAGAKIVGAFEEAIALMRTGDPLERHFTVRTYKVEFTPRDYGPDDVLPGTWPARDESGPVRPVPRG